MQYKRLGNAVAALFVAAAGWSVSTTIKPTQAETASKLEGEAATELSIPSDSAAPLSDNLASTDATSDSNATVAKVGESASLSSTQTSADQKVPAISKVFPHDIDDRQAATVYVRNIPVLTFLGDAIPAGDAEQSPTELRKVAATKATPANDEQALWKATKLVAEFNRLNRNGTVTPEDITVRWEEDSYIIEHGDDVLVTLAEDAAMLPDSTGAIAEDALQATNRLRRLLGAEEADALTEVADMPAPPPAPEPEVVAYAGSFYQEGEASWYGPGFHGRTSANGETYNQWAMTAAHKHLPFNTYVRVTNLNNGRYADVRINDRGPYIHGRVIDLSAAAADAIGMGGVAYVRIDILN